MKQLLYVFISLLFAGWFTSCKGPEELRQQLIYFKNIKDSSLNVATAYEPIVQKGDLLELSISGSILEKEAAEPIISAINKTSSAGSNKAGSSSANGYMVDETGSITIAFLGSLKVEGLTLPQVSGMIKEKLKKDIMEPVVSVRITNHKIVVLGEVHNPGSQNISDRVTIIDALGEAGDLTINGKRENIMIIRNDNGKKEIGRLNLNDGNIFTSPYYFLKNDDIVYVEMNKLAVPEKQSKALSYIQLGVAILASVSLVINIFKK